MPETVNDLEYLKISSEDCFPVWTSRETVAHFFHETMKPWHDTLEDVNRALDYAFSAAKGEGGFLMLAKHEGKLAGALLMLKTGMGNYIPPWILLFVAVVPDLRGMGIGRKICKKSIAECDGDVKLHVEYENPAKRLYERIGFTTKYAEMRFQR